MKNCPRSAVAAFVRALTSVSLVAVAILGVAVAATDARADTKTWSGAVDNLWSEPGNWQGGAPAPGDRVVFPDDAAGDALTDEGRALRALVNDLPSATDLYDITFLGNGYTISGNDLDLLAGVTQSSAQLLYGDTVDLNLRLLNSQTFSVTAGLTFGGTIDLSGYTLTLANQGGSILVTGSIIGTGDVIAGESLHLLGTSSYTGGLQGNLLIDGAAPNAAVTGSSLAGHGRVGPVTNSDIRPGGTLNGYVSRIDTPGALTIGDLESSGLIMQLNGLAPATEYDQVNVIGTVDVTGAVLQVSLGFLAHLGDTFVLVSDDGIDPVVGTFDLLPEGATISVGLYDFRISYVGGDGNDITLVCTGSPKTWTGAVDNLWSEPGNWSDGTPPSAGDRILFPAEAAPNRDLVNDLPAGTDLYELQFADGYTISGNDIDLNAGISQMGGSEPFVGNIVNLNVQLLNSQTFSDEPSSGSGVGPLTLGGSINLNGHTLTLAGASGSVIEVPGSIVGTGVVVVNSRVHLMGTNPYAGALQLNGVLLVDGSAPNATLEANGLNPGTLLAGHGQIGSVKGPGLLPGPTIQPGGTLSTYPIGDTIGQLTTGDLIKPYALKTQLNGLNPGTGYDQVSVNGTVDITGRPLDLSVGFVPQSGDTFVLVSNDGIDPVVGTFSGLSEGATLSVGVYQFRISYVGGDGNDITAALSLSPKTWTGAVNNLWSEPGNWAGGTIPVAGDRVIFPGDASPARALVNDLPGGMVLHDIIFTDVAYQHGYTITGNGLDLLSGIQEIYSPTNMESNTLNLNLRLLGSQRFTAVVGGAPQKPMTFGGTIDLNGQTLTLDGGRGMEIPGSITGTGNVIVRQAVRLVGTSTYTGALNIGSDSTLLLDGAVPSVVLTGYRLAGHGVVGSVASAEIVQPGGTPAYLTISGVHDTPGALAVGDLKSSSFMLQLDGSIPGAEYDQVNVTGTVDVTDAALQVSLGFTPARGQAFLVVDNDENDPVIGEFAGLPEGTEFNVGPYPFQVTYTGGTGNDVVLTSLSGDPLNAAPDAVDDGYGLDNASSAAAFSAPSGTSPRSSSRFRAVSSATLSVGGSGVLQNDSDPDGDRLAVALGSQFSVRGGTVTIESTGSFVYHPRAGFHGTDSFLYVAADGKGGTGFAYVDVFVHTCGDGVPEAPAEECDDANIVDGDGCDSNCTITRCGNGVVTAGEQCDNGGAVDGCCATDCLTETDGIACDDANACTEPGTCLSGVCQGETGIDCDDGNPCTDDTCDTASGCASTAVPIDASLCLSPRKALLHVKDIEGSAKDSLAWLWSKGEAFDQAGLGSPNADTTYTLCIYDTTASVPRLSASLVVAPSSTLWADKNPKGWSYIDKSGTSSGVQKFSLKPGADGKSNIKLSARGKNLLLPGPSSGGTYFDQEPEVLVQLLSSNGQCWSSEFSASNTLANDGVQFKAKTP